MNEPETLVPSCTNVIKVVSTWLDQVTLQTLNPTADLPALLQRWDAFQSGRDSSQSLAWLERSFHLRNLQRNLQQNPQSTNTHDALQWRGDDELMRKHGESGSWFQTEHFIVSVQTRTSTAADGSSHPRGVQHLQEDRKSQRQDQTQVAQSQLEPAAVSTNSFI